MSASRCWTEEWLAEQIKKPGYGSLENAKPKLLKKPVKHSELEEEMALQLEAAGLPFIAYTRQYKPIEGRKFRLDFAWPELRFALECDGAVHRIKQRFLADIERHNLLVLAGWKVIRVGRAQIMDGKAIGWLRQLFDRKVSL